MRVPQERFEQYDTFSRGLSQARRLIEEFGLNEESRLLDIGCGPATLPMGILVLMGEPKVYRGFDVRVNMVKASRKRVGDDWPIFQFDHVDAHNERYNSNGTKMGEGFELPLGDQVFDVINLFSVFSHMVDDDMKIYLEYLKPFLAPDGRMFFTAFAEERVPIMTDNPTDYLSDKWHKPLHCVRYNIDYIHDTLAGLGYEIHWVKLLPDTIGQRGFCVS